MTIAIDEDVLKEDFLDVGYEAMAADTACESVGSEWCNALVHDVMIPNNDRFHTLKRLRFGVISIKWVH